MSKAKPYDFDVENAQRLTGWGASRSGSRTCSSCGSSASDRRLDSRSRMRRESHVRFWEGVGVRFPRATRLIVGFERKDDAERLLGELRERFARFNLELHPDKTRLLEFGRRAAENRKRRGQGKPETFDFLGFTHICSRRRKDGSFTVRRKTMRKKMLAKLASLKKEMRRRMHRPIEEVGVWLRSVLQGHYRYYAVPRNSRTLGAFHQRIVHMWKRALSRRSQKGRVSWARMDVITRRWLPLPRILHPYPSQRLRVRTRGRSPVR